MSEWLVIDSLYCREQYFASHLDSYGHYLREAGEDVTRVCLNSNEPAKRDDWVGWAEPSSIFAPHSWSTDVAFFLDGYGRALDMPHVEKKIAQVAALTSPLPWEVRNEDGTPAFSLVISSIPTMVKQARAAGCRAELQELCFDSRALVCGMGVARDIPCLFVGTVDSNHRKRADVLRELGDAVTVMPPTFGRDYFKLLARAEVVVNIHAEWSDGWANALRLYEAAGMGARVASDGRSAGMGSFWVQASPPAMGWKDAIRHAREAYHDLQGDVVVRHGYPERIPQLVAWAKEL